VSGVYKNIAKVFANRLGRVVEKIISKPHNAYNIHVPHYKDEE
jgi:hypothetical protein